MSESDAKRLKTEDSAKALEDVQGESFLAKTASSTGPTIGTSDEPVHEIVGGSSIRQYLNKNLTANLLAGLKEVANKQPGDPLRFLGEFLIAKSDERRRDEELIPKQEEEKV